MLHAGDAEEDLDDDRATLDARLRARHADAGREVVEVEEDLDQPGAAEVVEEQQATAERADEPILGLRGEAGAQVGCDSGAVRGQLGVARRWPPPPTPP